MKNGLGNDVLCLSIFFFFFPQPSAPVVVSDLTNKMFSGAVVCGGGQ